MNPPSMRVIYMEACLRNIIKNKKIMGLSQNLAITKKKKK